MLLLGGRMSKYFIISSVFFSLSFCFFYDSHIGDEHILVMTKKTEVAYMQYPPLNRKLNIFSLGIALDFI